MNKKLLEIEKLEQLLQTNWTKFFNATQLFKRLLEDIRNHEFSKACTEKTLTNQPKMSITKVIVNNDLSIDFWIEFTLPSPNGLIVGTSIYVLQNRETFELKDSYGTVLTNQTTSI